MRQQQQRSGDQQVASRIRRILGPLRRQKNLPIVRDLELEFGEDSHGDPAVWVWFLLRRDVKGFTREMEDLSELAKAARAKLWDSDLQHRPYVGFRVAQESAAPHRAGH